MENAILSRTVAEEWIGDFNGLLLPEPDVSPQSGSVYVGTGEQIYSLLGRVKSGVSIIAFSAGALPADAITPEGCSLLVIDLPLSALHNRLSSNLSHYLRWQKTLSAVPFGPDYCWRLLQCSSDITGCSFFLFDGDFNIVSLGKAQDILEELAVTNAPKRPTPAQINKLFGRLLTENLSEGAPVHFQTGHHIYTIQDNGEVLGFLFVVVHNTGRSSECFFRLLVDHLRASLRAEGVQAEVCGQPFFRQFLERMEVYYRHYPRKLLEDMAKLPQPGGPWVRFLLIAPEEGRSSLTRLYSEVEKIFTKSNLTIYNGRIVLMLSFQESAAVDVDACGITSLEQLLEVQGGYAIWETLLQWKKVYAPSISNAVKS